MNGQSWTFIGIALAALTLSVGLVEHRALAAHTPPAPPSTTTSIPLSGHPPIDLARSEAPLFDDAVFHGASDPFVIWNPVKKAWFMYYTQRRATMPIQLVWTGFMVPLLPLRHRRMGSPGSIGGRARGITICRSR